MTWKSLLRQLTSIALTLALAVPLFTSCSKEEKEVVTPAPPTPDKPQEVVVTAPTIEVRMSEVNVFWGAKVAQADTLLLIGNDTVASWSLGNAMLKSITLVFNGDTISFGTVLNEAGFLTLWVMNDKDKYVSKSINIKDEALYGVEKLKQAAMKVDNEINLLEWITFADGVELVKVEVEIDGQRMSIPEPYHFSPEYPWVCNVIFTVKWKSGNSAEINVDNLTIKPLDYNAPSLESANPIQEYFSRYNNLTPKTKEFIYQHLLTSYLCMDRYHQDNMEYILVGEVPEEFECENIWSNYWLYYTWHADQGYWNLKHLAPKSIIKACFWTRLDLENYINQHPNKVFMVSCAVDALWWRTAENLKSDPTYDALKRILWNENIIVSCAIGNNGNNIKTLNENNQKEEKWWYSSPSVNSNKNNKITVVWYDPRHDNIFWYNTDSRRPVWFWEWNIVVPFIPLVGYGGYEWWDLTWDTHSSFPTSAESWSLWNFLSILMHNYPWTTLEDAMTIMLDNYLREETFKYKNDDWNIVDGDKWYFFDTDKFLNNEILHKSDIDAIQLTGDEVVLPSVPGIIYEGEGIQFEYGGQKYDVSDTSHLTSALTSDVSIRWFWNKPRFRKYGGTRSATIKAQYVDTRGKAVPDVSLTVKRNVQ